MSASRDLATLAAALDAFDAAVQAASDACERRDLLALATALDTSEAQVARVSGLVASLETAAVPPQDLRGAALPARLARALRSAAQLSANLALATDETRDELRRLGRQTAAVSGYGRTAGSNPRLDRTR